MDRAIQSYIDSLPNEQATDSRIRGTVVDPQLRAKILEARRHSKARPGLGPGSYEAGSEYSLDDSTVFDYEAGTWQRWVKSGGKCFLVTSQTGLDSLRGASEHWKRTRCKAPNSFYQQ